MSTAELKANIREMVDSINNEQILYMLYDILKTMDLKRNGELWDSLTSGQKKEVLMSFDESEDDDNLIDMIKIDEDFGRYDEDKIYKKGNKKLQ